MVVDTAEMLDKLREDFLDFQLPSGDRYQRLLIRLQMVMRNLVQNCFGG